METRHYTLRRGDTYPLEKFRIKSNGEVITLGENDQIYFVVRKDYEKNTPVSIKKKIGDGIFLEDDGYYHLVLDPEDTENLEYGKYVYDIQYTHIAPKRYVKTIIEGSIKITEEVTRKEDEY